MKTTEGRLGGRFTLAWGLKATGTMGNIYKIFNGELDPIQAMLTRRLKVEGSMAYLLRNVPTVLDFIRCCRLVPMES